MVLGFEIFWEEFIGHWGEEREPEPGFMAFNRRALIFYVTFMTSGTFVALGALTLWHARLINAGQTSIEAHINRSETKRLAELGKIYRNPYDFGPKHNWHLFLGLVDGRGWSCIIFPSRHSPPRDGLTWDTVAECRINWTYGGPGGGKLS